MSGDKELSKDASEVTLLSLFVSFCIVRRYVAEELSATASTVLQEMVRAAGGTR